MSPGTPRCVYCSKPTRSHELTIAPVAYAAAYGDRSYDADHGTYLAAVCHGCWSARDESALRELVETGAGGNTDDPEGTGDGGDRERDSDDDGRLSEAARTAIREMHHEHVRFELVD